MSVDALVRYYETLSPQAVREMGRYYTEGAFFKDPFNEVRGLRDIQIIFTHMFDVLIEPRFIVVNRIVNSSQLMLEWDFQFRMNRIRAATEWTIHGVSHLRLAPDGRVEYHRDYWDSGEELYVHLPIAGSIVRFLRRQMRAPGTTT